MHLIMAIQGGQLEQPRHTHHRHRELLSCQGDHVTLAKKEGRKEGGGVFSGGHYNCNSLPSCNHHQQPSPSPPHPSPPSHLPSNLDRSASVVRACIMKIREEGSEDDYGCYEW